MGIFDMNVRLYLHTVPKRSQLYSCVRIPSEVLYQLAPDIDSHENDTCYKLDAAIEYTRVQPDTEKEKPISNISVRLTSSRKSQKGLFIRRRSGDETRHARNI